MLFDYKRVNILHNMYKIHLTLSFTLIDLGIMRDFFRKKRDEEEAPALPWADDEIVELWDEEAA